MRWLEAVGERVKQYCQNEKMSKKRGLRQRIEMKLSAWGQEKQSI